MINNGKETITEHPTAPQSYDKGRLMMEAYLVRIKSNQSTKEKLTAMVDAKTNTITRYI